MRSEVIQQFILSSGDVHALTSLVHIAVEPHVDHNNEAEKKLVNVLLNERIYPQSLMTKTLDFLELTKTRINSKLETINQEIDIDNLPEITPNSIILRPKEFMNVIVENYQQQTKNVNQIIEILTVESFDEEEIEYEQLKHERRNLK